MNLSEMCLQTPEKERKHSEGPEAELLGGYESMEEQKKQVSLSLAVTIMAVIVAMLLICIKGGVGIVVPLFLAWAVVYCFSRILGFDYDEVFAAGLNALRKASGALMIMISVGMLVGTMISAGTIPAFIYYGLRMINPRIFLFCCCIITAIMALATGTSYGSAASAGIALMGIGTAMGMPIGMVAAAVLCGALFGDKISPLSDVPVLCSGLVEGDLFKSIRYSLWTSVPPYIISCLVFLVLGFKFGGANYDPGAVNEVLEGLSSNFHISVIALLPIIAVILLLILKVPSVPAIMGGAVFAAVIAVAYQGMAPGAVFATMYKGFSIDTGVKVVDSLLNRGGISSMAQSSFILIGAVVLGGMLDEMGVINAFLKPIIPSLNSEFKIMGATLLTSCFINAVGSAAWLSHILTAKLMGPVFKKADMEPELLSRTMEDAYCFGTIIFPWHAMTIYFTGVLGCTWSDYMPYIFFSYLTPVFTVLCAVTGIGMYRKARNK